MLPLQSLLGEGSSISSSRRIPIFEKNIISEGHKQNNVNTYMFFNNFSLIKIGFIHSKYIQIKKINTTGYPAG